MAQRERVAEEGVAAHLQKGSGKRAAKLAAAQEKLRKMRPGASFSGGTVLGGGSAE